MSNTKTRPKRTFGIKVQENNSKFEEKFINTNNIIHNEVEYNKRNSTLSPNDNNNNNFISFEDSYQNSNFEFYECPICNEEILGLYQLNIHLDTVHTENKSGNVILSLFKKTQKITEEITGTTKTNEKPTQPVIDKSHWQKSTNDDKCSYPECEKPLGIRNGKQNCYCCGKLFCDMHTNFSMRLSESAKPDSNSPFWYKVCQSCYTSREGYNNTEGQRRNLTNAFIEARKNNIEKLCLEENLLILRLEKLAQLKAEINEKKGISINQKALEQSIVQWKEDASSIQCSICRRHHCRLCGKLICSNCIEDIPLFTDIENDKTYSGSTKSCNQCKRIVFRKKVMNAKEKIPSVVKLYEQIKFNQSIIETILPQYNDILLHINSKSSKNYPQDYQNATKYREKLIKNFHQIDLLSKRILKLPTNSKYYRTLQNNIAKGSVIYLQNNMITLKMLPEKNDVTIINEDIENTKRIKEIKDTLDVLNDQYTLLQGYYQDALFRRKFDNVKTLEESIQDVTDEIQKLKTELEEIS
ncbi:hypothetical protein BCR32DRAFT_16335 [Anaeromyces robustus]|uniref:FYVE-type domain-containing protein n=1 Tax=Anaeromyces robustus TaxID=1754192 RepID=A0A1Y1XMX7_9FUNG|nr:hypothetical protein BCR32DRAFT_16335 [Anaeromyces robustus]|eukprot:ORX87073.1 hypothetical protein BCR32DRAFT_16335 [Anaeromyces robustus]